MLVRFAIALLVTTVLFQAAVRHATAAPVTLTEQGWTVSADADNKLLSVRHERTGGCWKTCGSNCAAPTASYGRGNGPSRLRPHHLSIITEAPGYGGSSSRPGTC